MSGWAITGGSGFVGGHLVRRLLASGHAVRSLDVAPPPRALVTAGLVDVRGDVRDAGAAARLCRDAAVVVHAAAALPIRGSAAEIRSVNVDGTATVLAAAAEAGARRAVLVSSGVVYGVGRPQPVSEETPPAPIDAYGVSKLEAEALCDSFGQRGLESVVLRPQAIVGPGRLGAFGLLFDWVREGRRVYVLGRGTNRYQLLAVDDLVDAIMRAAEAPVAGSTFNLGATRIGTVAENLTALVAHAGTTSRVVTVPAAPARALLRTLDVAGLSPLSRWHYESADRDCVVSVARARRELGWRPARSNVEALAAAYDWHVRRPAPPPRGRSHRATWPEGALGLLRRVS